MNKRLLQCLHCDETWPTDEVRYRSSHGELLYLTSPPEEGMRDLPQRFDQRLSSRKDIDRSGVWRFREAVLDVGEEAITTHPEGNTNLYSRPALCRFANLDNLWFKHEGENPTGSFKDRGMTVAVTQAKKMGLERVACASTGNTSASLAAYAAQAGMQAFVFLPAGKVASGKLAQAIAYGATCLAVRGDFDDAMRVVQEASFELGLYLVNSLNPFRLEGQKTIVWEIFQDLLWQAPDWIVVPAGNLGNTSAFGKAIDEAYRFGWIDKKPRLASIQAQGANPFYQAYVRGFGDLEPVKAETLATAIRIGNPVNYPKAWRWIQELHGVVGEVSDSEILEAKAIIDRAGIGCEPASATSLAGIRKLRNQGVIQPGETVVGILTGNLLKDPDAIFHEVSMEQSLQEIEANLDAVRKAIDKS